MGMCVQVGDVVPMQRGTYALIMCYLCMQVAHLMAHWLCCADHAMDPKVRACHRLVQCLVCDQETGSCDEKLSR